ncbi:MAG: SPFH domain-containing protein [Planctomycetota bacterium]
MASPDDPTQPESPDANLAVDSAPPVAPDPAAQSLSDALRVAFLLLKFVMVILVVIYLVSGTFTVDQQQAAVKLRFGKIVGEPGQRVFGPGTHLGLPLPFESRVIVTTAPQAISLNSAFFFERGVEDQTKTDDELAQEGRTGPLNPLTDGYLITGDANIVHGTFRVTYRVPQEDVETYVRTIRDPEHAQSITRTAAERGLVHAAATVEADDFIAGRARLSAATDHANRTLTGLSTGITIDRIEVIRPAMPIAARAAYNQVNNAEAERAKAIEEAERDRARTLQSAGGPAAAPRADRRDGPLTQLINAYEATPRNDPGRVELENQLNQALRQLSLETERGTFAIGGEAALIIEQAQSLRTNRAEGVTREAERFRQLNTAYEANPKLFRQRFLQAARRNFFNPDNFNETFYLPSGSEVYLEINRDPRIAKERERRQAEDLGVADR